MAQTLLYTLALRMGGLQVVHTCVLLKHSSLSPSVPTCVGSTEQPNGSGSVHTSLLPYTLEESHKKSADNETQSTNSDNHYTLQCAYSQTHTSLVFTPPGSWVVPTDLLEIHNAHGQRRQGV